MLWLKSEILAKFVLTCVQNILELSFVLIIIARQRQSPAFAGRQRSIVHLVLLAIQAYPAQRAIVVMWACLVQRASMERRVVQGQGVRWDREDYPEQQDWTDVMESQASRA